MRRMSTILELQTRIAYRDIAELPPASTLTVDARGLGIRRFWQLRSAPHEDSLETTVETIRALLCPRTSTSRASAGASNRRHRVTSR